MCNLIEEYKATSARMDQANNLIWRTAFIPLTIVATAFGACLSYIAEEKSSALQIGWILIFVGAPVSFCSLRWWNDISDRWNDYMKAWTNRLKEIENQLSLSSNSDIPPAPKGYGVRDLRLKLELYVSFGWLIVWLVYLVITIVRYCKAGCYFDVFHLVFAIFSMFMILCIFILSQRRVQRP